MSALIRLHICSGHNVAYVNRHFPTVQPNYCKSSRGIGTFLGEAALPFLSPLGLQSKSQYLTRKEVAALRSNSFL